MPAPTKEIVTNTTRNDDPFAHYFRPENPEETTNPLDMKNVVRELGEDPTEGLGP